MSHSLFTATFRLACGQPCCPFCWMQEEDERRYMRSLIHEYTLAPDIHAHLAASAGFCARHAQMLIETEWAMERDGLGTATLYESVLKQLEAATAKALETSSKRPVLRKFDPNEVFERILAALHPQETCLACLHSRQNERFALQSWNDYLSEEGLEADLAQTYLQAWGVCLPHLLRLLEQRPSLEVARWLLNDFQTKLQQRRKRLEAYIHKHDVRHRHELREDERHAWIEAVTLTAGGFLDRRGGLL